MRIIKILNMMIQQRMLIQMNRRLQEMMKHGYVERVGNAYRVTDKVNIPDLQGKLQRRIDMILQTANELSKLQVSGSATDTENTIAVT